MKRSFFKVVGCLTTVVVSGVAGLFYLAKSDLASCSEEGHLAVSGDRQTIAVTLAGQGENELVLVRSNGQIVNRLRFKDTYLRDVALGGSPPDIFVSTAKNCAGPFQLARIDPITKSQQPIKTPFSSIGPIACSHDGRYLAAVGYVSYTAVRLMSTPEQKPELFVLDIRMMRWKAVEISDYSWLGKPTWSKDDDAIRLWASTSGAEKLVEERRQGDMWLSEVHNVGQDFGTISNAIWDGTTLIALATPPPLSNRKLLFQSRGGKPLETVSELDFDDIAFSSEYSEIFGLAPGGQSVNIFQKSGNDWAVKTIQIGDIDRTSQPEQEAIPVSRMGEPRSMRHWCVSQIQVR